tara:strand:+ start:2035 stop:2709 length:675 start_codon:yes stop_codon:yes gene_type:complete
MNKIYPNVDKGIQKISSSTFNTMRTEGGGSIISEGGGATIQYLNLADAAYQNKAFFLEFDTRTITIPPVSVTFNMYIYHMGIATPNPPFYIMRSYWASDNSLVVGDYQSWLKTSSDGSVDLSNMHKHSSKQTPQDDTWFNITLDDEAIQGMVDRDYFQIAVITHHEVDGVSTPNDGSAYNFTMYTDEIGDPGASPYLEYEPGIMSQLKVLNGTTKVLSGNLKIK